MPRLLRSAVVAAASALCLGACTSSAPEPEALAPRTMAGEDRFRQVFRSDVRARPPSAPSWSVRQDPVRGQQLVITRPGTLLCPYRIGTTDLATTGVLTVALEAVGPPNGDLRRVACGFRGTITLDLGTTATQDVVAVVFDKDGLLSVRSDGGAAARACRGPAGECVP